MGYLRHYETLKEDTVGRKEIILEQVQVGWESLHKLVDGLSYETLVMPPTYGEWSIKDHVAHICAWEKSLIALIEGKPRHQAMGIDERAYESGTEEANNAIYVLNKDRPLAEVLQDFRDTHSKLMDRLGELTEEDLFDYRPYEDNDACLAEYVLGNTCDHYAEHLEAIRSLVTRT